MPGGVMIEYLLNIEKVGIEINLPCIENTRWGYI